MPSLKHYLVTFCLISGCSSADADKEQNEGGIAASQLCTTVGEKFAESEDSTCTAAQMTEYCEIDRQNSADDGCLAEADALLQCWLDMAETEPSVSFDCEHNADGTYGFGGGADGGVCTDEWDAAFGC